MLGKVDRTAVIAAKHKIHRVIVVSPVALRELVESLVLADEVRVRVDVVPELYEVFIGTVDTIVGDIPLMEITRSGRTNTYVGVKRVLDIVLSLVADRAAQPHLPARRPRHPAHHGLAGGVRAGAGGEGHAARSPSTSCARW